jgi:Bacterial Ig-like domain (group 3)/Matrixin
MLVSSIRKLLKGRNRRSDAQRRRALSTRLPRRWCFEALEARLVLSPLAGDIQAVVTSDNSVSIYGESVTLTAAVTNLSGSGAAPTGSVEFFDGATDLGPGGLANVGNPTASWSLTTPSLHAGAHSITAAYIASGNFSNATSVAFLQTVGKADADLEINGYEAPYDGLAHGLSGTATGAFGESLNGLLNLGGEYTDAGTSAAAWYFAGNQDYNSAGGTFDIVIDKAYANIEIDGYTGPYDGHAHGISGTATGVLGEPLSSLLHFGGATRMDAGVTTGTWSFAGNNDYVGAADDPVSETGTADIAINPANTTTTVTSSSGANASAFNSAVTFTAMVSNTDSAVPPAGHVEFYDGMVDTAHHLGSGTPSTITSSTAAWTFATSTLAVGTHSIIATYTPATVLDNTGHAVQDFTPSDNSAAPLLQTVKTFNLFNGFLQPVSLNRAFKLGSTIPLKWQVTDANGKLITTTSVISKLTVKGTHTGTYTLYDGAKSYYTSGGTVLRYDTAGSQFVFNWSTGAPFIQDTYTVTVTLSDGTNHSGTVTLSTNGGNYGLVIDGTNANAHVAGGLLAGDLTLYVDNSNGKITADEMARIEEAVANVETLISPYGTDLHMVDSTIGDAANIVIELDSTSAVGGMADGVLGCTTTTGLITFIDGWNWYAGTDPNRVGLNQYDFQTVVTHELGHSLGLGHSSDPSSVMYPTLDTGVARRAMVLADLNIADADGTADGLHALFPHGHHPSKRAVSHESFAKRLGTEASILGVATFGAAVPDAAAIVEWRRNAGISPTSRNGVSAGARWKELTDQLSKELSVAHGSRGRSMLIEKHALDQIFEWLTDGSAVASGAGWRA